MENVVTMSLEEYTKLIIENNNLKLVISNYKREALRKVDEEIRESKINSIQTSEEVKKYLNLSDERLLNEFTSVYSWTWKSIADNCYNVFTAQEIKDMATAEIKRMLDERLKDLLDKEEEKNNEN